jgi:hypothetical protein
MLTTQYPTLPDNVELFAKKIDSNLEGHVSALDGETRMGFSE